MRHLERHNYKKVRSQAIFFGVVLLIIIIFIFSTGIRLLLQTSFFINQLASSKKTQPTSSNEDFYGSITLDPIALATSSAEIIVTGSVYNFDKIAFYLNDEKVKEISVTGDTFSETLDNLDKGSNDVYAIALSQKTKKTKKSEKYTIDYLHEKPKLEVTDPKDQQTVNKSDIALKGLTDKNITIHVNNLPVVVDTQGNFQTSLTLHEGDNKIDVTATDIAENTNTVSLIVKYHKDE